MKATPIACALLTALASGLLAVAARGQGPANTPSDEGVIAAIRTIQERHRALLPDRRAAQQQHATIVREALADIDLSQLTGPQVSMLAMHLQAHRDDEQVSQYRRSLERISQEQTVYGAIALAERVMVGGKDKEALLAALWAHPGVARAMNTRHLHSTILRFLSGFEPTAMRKHIEDVQHAILSIEPAGMVKPLSRATIARLLKVLDDSSIAADVSSQRFAIHAHLLRVSRAALAGFAPGFNDFQRDAQRIEKWADLVAFLEGAAGRAELVGHAAPELDFRWFAGPDAPVAKLSELEGKVVVLDFWATWCGPCVDSFPDVAKLQAHYAKSDVVVIGVTSLQGFHVPGDGREPIEVQGQPEREIELMAEFAKEKKVTWNLAFSRRPVMDPRYGVSGIPHLTIIDAAGIVRHNKLHPSMPLDKKVALIDPLLQDADR